MSKETLTLVEHGVPVIHAIEYVFKAIMLGGFRLEEFHNVSDSSFLCMPARPRPTIKVAISRHEPVKTPEPEFKPGGKVYLDDGRECLYVSSHPEHQVHVLETPDNEFITRTTEEISKEPTKPTPLNIPWGSIAENWIYAAMDKDGDIWFFEEKPVINSIEEVWDTSRDSECVENVLAIPVEDINWKRSLTKRPNPCEGPKHINCRCAVIDPVSITINDLGISAGYRIKPKLGGFGDIPVRTFLDDGE